MPIAALGHEYEVTKSTADGGFCDCGHTDFIRSDGCCDAHTPKDRLDNPCTNLPVSVELPIRMLIRGILSHIVSSDLKSSVLSKGSILLMTYLHDVAASSNLAASIVGEEVAGQQFNSTYSPLPYNERDQKALYPLSATQASPIVPLLLKSSSLRSDGSNLIVFLASLSPFRVSLTNTILELYTTLDLDNLSLGFDQGMTFVMVTTLSFQTSITHTTDPDPTRNTIHLLCKRFHAMFMNAIKDPQSVCGLNPLDEFLATEIGNDLFANMLFLQTILKKDFNGPFITANNIAILQSLSSALSVLQDFKPVHRELVQPAEYPTPLSGDIISGIEVLISSIVPMLFKLSSASKDNIAKYTSDDSILSLILQITSSNKRDLINSILNNLRSFDTSLDTYIQNNDKTLSEQDRLAHRARGLAHQKAIREKMIQQQKNFSDINQLDSCDLTSMDIQSSDSSSEHTCVICREGSLPDRPLGAMSKIEYSFVRTFNHNTNLTPTIRANRPEYLQDLPSVFRMSDVPDNATQEIAIGIRLSVSSVPVSITSCKHLMHQSCLDSYSGDIDFICPLCNSIENSLIPIDDLSSSLSESFYSRYLTIFFKQSHDILAKCDYLIIPMVFSAIESLEIRSRPSTFLNAPDQLPFHALKESDFQSQLTTIRMTFQAIKPLISQRTKDLVNEYLECGYQYDHVSMAIFSIYSNDNGDLSDLEISNLIRGAYIQATHQCIEHLIDQDYNGLSQKEKQTMVFDWITGSLFDSMNDVIDKIEKRLVPHIRRLYILQHLLSTTIGKTSLDVVKESEHIITLEQLDDTNNLIKMMKLPSVRATFIFLPRMPSGNRLRDRIRYLSPQPIEMVQLPSDFMEFFFNMNNKVPSDGCDSRNKAMCLLCSETVCLDTECIDGMAKHTRNCFYPIFENIYFDRLGNPASKPSQHLTLSKSSYRQLYINWLKGTYEDK
eukprot:gene17346-20695_t